MKSEVKVKWQVSRACTNDSIYIYPARGKSSVTRVSIKDLTEGEMTFKVCYHTHNYYNIHNVFIGIGSICTR